MLLKSSLSFNIKGWVNSSTVVFDPTALALNKLNMFPDESTKVTSIVVPDPASSDTNIDFITAVVAEGVYTQ